MTLGFGATWIQEFIIFGLGWGCSSPGKPDGKFGVLWDTEFLLKEQVAVATRRPFVQVERHLYPFLDQETLHLVTHALITPSMNYCNALLMWLPLKHIQRLKLMQNAVTKELHVHLDLHMLHHKTRYVLPVSYPESQIWMAI